MADTLTTFTNLINSPPGVLVAGGVLAGIVWKFFDKVEEKLNDDTKLEIAIWLLGVKVGQKVEPWPETFAKLFDRVFGVTHLSWKCFWRSCLSSLILTIIVYLLTQPPNRFQRYTYEWFRLVVMIVIANVLPDYFSLLETRLALGAMLRLRTWPWLPVLLGADAIITASVALFSSNFAQAFVNQGWNLHTAAAWGLAAMENPVVILGLQRRFRFWYLFYPAFFTSIWLWLYAGSGFLLKAARRFDVGFQWFNRRFDIEKKPLSSIGLVAGSLVALIYWAAVVVGKVA